MRRLPKDWVIYELRGKRGRKHVVMYRGIHPTDELSWRWEPFFKIIGPVAWYKGRSKSQMKRVTDWFPYW